MQLQCNATMADLHPIPSAGDLTRSSQRDGGAARQPKRVPRAVPSGDTPPPPPPCRHVIQIFSEGAAATRQKHVWPRSDHHTSIGGGSSECIPDLLADADVAACRDPVAPAPGRGASARKDTRARDGRRHARSLLAKREPLDGEERGEREKKTKKSIV